jgi:cytochrome P450
MIEHCALNELDITSPEVYSDPSTLHKVYARLRREAPVLRIDRAPYRTFWALTRHAEISEVSRQNKLFINEPRLTLTPQAVEDRVLAQNMGRRVAVRTIIDMDEPDHRKYRAITQSWFLGQGVAQLQGRVEAVVKRFVDRMAELDGHCDFAQDVASQVPLHVIMALLGLPEEDAPFILRGTQALLAASDPDLQRDPSAYGADVMQELFSYFGELVARRRAEPTEDLGSVIANGMIDGAPMAIMETLSYLLISSTAGHETTSSAMGGGMLELLRSPDSMQALRAEPGLWETAADEVVRWVSPVRHFMRTTVADYELAGVKIKTGDSLGMFYLSANRDETVFERANEFRPGRSPNRHLGFGIGSHFCLGRLLALSEIRALFRELLARVPQIELDGEAQWVQSNFVGGLKRLPVRYRMA